MIERDTHTEDLSSAVAAFGSSGYLRAVLVYKLASRGLDTKNG